MTRRSLPLAAVLAAALIAAGCAASGARAPSPAELPQVATRSVTAVDPALSATVVRLGSPDFVERTKAAELLVSRGSEALPALGAAGEQPVAAPGDDSVSSTRPVVEAILASAKADAVETELISAWPTVRRAAAEELGRRGRWSPIPNLIERLDDTDEEVRGASVASLRRLTNNFFGYRANGSTGSRSGAAVRWQSWWNQVGRALADAPGGGSVASR